MRTARSIRRPSLAAALACALLLTPLCCAPLLAQATANVDDRLTRLANQLAEPSASADPEAPAPTTPGIASVRVDPPAIAESGSPTARNEALPLTSRGSQGHATLTGDGDGAKSTNWMLSTFTALGVVIVLILLVRSGLSRLSGQPIAARSSAVVEVLSRTSVAPRNHVVLVRLGARVLVLGDSPNGLRTLAQLEDPDEVAAVLSAVAAERPHSITGGFNQLLSRFHGEYRDPQRLADEGGDHQEHAVDRARDQVSGLLSRIRHMTGRGQT